MDFMAQEEKANFIWPGACFGGRVVKVDEGLFGTFSTVYSYVEEGRRLESVTMEVWSVEEGSGVGTVVVQSEDVVSRYLTVNVSDVGDLTHKLTAVSEIPPCDEVMSDERSEERVASDERMSKVNRQSSDNERSSLTSLTMVASA
jgi:hypothetical protein